LARCIKPPSFPIYKSKFLIIAAVSIKSIYLP